MYEYKCKVLNVIDGDTFDVKVDLGFNIYHQIRVRLLDIDTPEIKNHPKINTYEKDLGLICKSYATDTFLNKEFIITTHKDKLTDSFGRYLVTVYLDDKHEFTIKDLYDDLGINKLNKESYSEDKVRKLGESYAND